MEKLDYALALAAKGFYVFRLQRDGKRPFAKGWQNEATRDPDLIHGLFHNHDFNIGIYAGRYRNGRDTDEALVIVDVDVKDGKQGNETIAMLDVLGYDLPPTYQALTASHGRHLFYAHPTPLQGGANKLGLHVDVKSAGGYVVAEGSTIGGIPYTNYSNSPPSPCPPWIVNKLGLPIERKKDAQLVQALDSPEAVQRGMDYLTSPRLPDAIDGAGRNATAYKIACALRDFGVSETTAAQLFDEHYNPIHVKPPYPFERIEAVVNHAYSYAKLPLGNKSPDTDFKTADKNSAPHTPGKLFMIMIGDLSLEKPRPALIEGMIEPGVMSVLYGESNTGKTFVAMDMAYHIAAGLPWDNRRVAQGPVLYVAAEAGRNAQNRLLALREHFNPVQPLPLALVPCPLDLRANKQHAKELIELASHLQAATGQPPALIVIDTLSRALAGGDENSSTDMGEFVKTLDAIRDATRAHLMVVHHSGKDTARGARGHSLLRAATDTEIELAEGNILTRKQRDMEFAKPIGFDLVKVTLSLTDAYDIPLTSCVVRKTTAKSTRDALKMEPRDLVALLALKECKTNRIREQYLHVVSLEEWAQSCKDCNMAVVPDAKPWPTNINSFKIAFKRSRDRLLVLEKVVEVAENEWAVTPGDKG